MMRVEGRHVFIDALSGVARLKLKAIVLIGWKQRLRRLLSTVS
jgi:hypothetical protein